jgi:hypothetical protein
MAALDVSIIAELTGLGQDINLAEKFASTTAPTRGMYHYAIQDVADTDQALDVGDVSTVELIILKCISNDVDIDTSYVSSFVAEIEVQEGEVAVFKPTGTVYFKNDDASEQSTIEYIVVGT